VVETSERIAFLKKIHLFYGLEDGELESIADKLSEASYPKGEVVFQQESKSESFYMIYGGSVRIASSQQGKEFQLALLVKNDYFGEMGLIARRNRSGTVTATSDTLLLVLSRKDFEMFYKSTPQLRLNLDVAVRSRKLARTLRFKWLRPDEVIYFLARKHPVIMYQSLFVPAFALVVPVTFSLAYFTIAPYFIVALASVLSLLAIAGWIVWRIIDWGNDYYIVTNQRVVWLEKVVGLYDSRQESPLSTILSVGVETTQFGRILDYGHVIVRTWVGKIPFNNVIHPEQAQHMIEEYWNRTKEHATIMEKEAIKNAIRKRLNLPMPKQERGFGEPAPIVKKEAPPPKPNANWQRILRYLGANTLKLRYETGENVIYRKHWVVLVIGSWIPFAGTLILVLLLFYRLIQLAIDPNQALIASANGFSMDSLVVVYLLALIPFLGWLIYKVMDWSNDKFEVTNEQIIDIDRKPFGSESRNASQLESILGTYYERRGLLGNIFNFGTVYITVGGSQLAFEDVMDPATVQSDIDRRRMARQARQNEAKIAGERDRMAEWLATYHRTADQFKEEERKNQKKE